METRTKKVILGMSGGVDSSTALYLLKEQGFDVLGVTLNFFKGQDIQNAKKVCQQLKVEHLVIDASRVFGKKIIKYFLEEFKKGRTPSPCLFCNRDVKIELLISLANKYKVDYVSTGHYAKIKDGLLFKAKDKTKDQTYFLAFLKKRHLSKLIFPLGDYTKTQVYAIARKQGIKFKEEQSQDLCFISGKVADFLIQKLGQTKGKIIDGKGNVLGKHQGIWFYTLGQRKGIKLSGGPFWVKGFSKNNVIVARDERELFTKKVSLSHLNFIIGRPKKSIPVEAKLRYRQLPAKAILVNMGQTRANWQLIFNKEQRAPTPGQIAVFYQGQMCIGGGVIN